MYSYKILDIHILKFYHHKHHVHVEIKMEILRHISNNNDNFLISSITCILSKPLFEMFCLLMMSFTTSKDKTHMLI